MKGKPGRKRKDAFGALSRELREAEMNTIKSHNQLNRPGFKPLVSSLDNFRQAVLPRLLRTAPRLDPEQRKKLVSSLELLRDDLMTALYGP
jgi:hypothetical protein